MWALFRVPKTELALNTAVGILLMHRHKRIEHLPGFPLAIIERDPAGLTRNEMDP